MKKSTLAVQKNAHVINSIYVGRYKASLLKDEDHILNTYKYVLRNPVVVNLSKKAEEYPYSKASRPDLIGQYLNTQRTTTQKN